MPHSPDAFGKCFPGEELLTVGGIPMCVTPGEAYYAFVGGRLVISIDPSVSEDIAKSLVEKGLNVEGFTQIK